MQRYKNTIGYIHFTSRFAKGTITSAMRMYSNQFLTRLLLNHEALERLHWELCEIGFVLAFRRDVGSNICFKNLTLEEFIICRFTKNCSWESSRIFFGTCKDSIFTLVHKMLLSEFHGCKVIHKILNLKKIMSIIVL